MILSKAELLASLQKEIRILSHLAGKVTPAMLDYRPTPGQRSTLELLRYLTVMGPVLLDSILAGKFLVDDWNASEGHAATLDLPAIIASLQSQSARYAEVLEATSDATLLEPLEMFGTAGTRARHILDLILCGHAAYRTQLFCYLKACGLAGLNTMNLWAGVDAA
jgi:hypothetical protein